MNLFSKDRIRFDRNELAGSFGDIGTDLPLIVGMILAAGLDSGSVAQPSAVAALSASRADPARPKVCSPSASP